MTPNSTADDALSNPPPRTADLEETWAFLEIGVHHIMNNPESGLVFVNYENLYTTVYNYCLWTNMQGKPGRNRYDANPVCSNLYSKLSEYFVSHFKPMKEKTATLQDEDLLRYYAAEWDRYTMGATHLNRLFTYFNRSWVQRERIKGEKGVYQVYSLALAQWKIHFFEPIQKENSKLAGAILRLIERERNGDVIDQGLVKKVIFSFVSIGLDDTDPDKECLDVYKEHFEAPFIDGSGSYYKKESEAFVAENTVSEYLKKAEDRLREEEDRVERYLHTTTRKELIAKCEHVLIREHAELMWDNFQKLSDSNQDEDLQRMYALLTRIPEGLEPISQAIQGTDTRVPLMGIPSITTDLSGYGCFMSDLIENPAAEGTYIVDRRSASVKDSIYQPTDYMFEFCQKTMRRKINQRNRTSASNTRNGGLLIDVEEGVSEAFYGEGNEMLDGEYQSSDYSSSEIGRMPSLSVPEPAPAGYATPGDIGILTEEIQSLGTSDYRRSNQGLAASGGMRITGILWEFSFLFVFRFVLPFGSNDAGYG
ncbi:Cullin repeat-like-containing domain protein, partial [Mycena floridula]